MKVESEQELHLHAIIYIPRTSPRDCLNSSFRNLALLSKEAKSQAHGLEPFLTASVDDELSQEESQRAR